MKCLARLVLAVAVILSASCSKDKDSGSVAFSPSTLYLPSAGSSATVTLTIHNVASLRVSSYPDGWPAPAFDFAARTLVVTAPADMDAPYTDRTGNVEFLGLTPGGTSVAASLFVGVVPTEDMTSKVANCYLVNKQQTNYIIDATRRGDGSAFTVDHVAVIWQSSTDLLQNITLHEGKCSFYVGSNADGDGINGGNALLGAYDSKGSLLWSWHIWSTDYDPQTEVLVYADGSRMMSYNLGARKNDNSTTDDILASYGLYYQWGRKDPFIGPSTYQASDGSSASSFDSKGARVAPVMVACDASTGTTEYARLNPLTFITGVEASAYDWLWSASSNTLWSDTKTINDPCPYGWRVAPVSAFAGLSIVEDLTAGWEPYYDAFGWTLTDGSTESFYMAAGRRRYDNGKIQNIYNPLPMRGDAMEAQPWEGIFWTTATQADGKAKAFYFWFNKSDVETSGVSDSTPYARANGLQVRCVKE